MIVAFGLHEGLANVDEPLETVPAFGLANYLTSIRSDSRSGSIWRSSGVGVP